jgi:hypothetical protein
MIWPALRKEDDGDDLLVVESWEFWVRDTDLSGYDVGGRLIARDGAVFDLVFIPPATRWRRFLDDTGFLQPVPTGEHLDADQLVALVRAYVKGFPPPVIAEFAARVAAADEATLADTLIAFVREHQ